MQTGKKTMSCSKVPIFRFNKINNNTVKKKVYISIVLHLFLKELLYLKKSSLNRNYLDYVRKKMVRETTTYLSLLSYKDLLPLVAL